MKKHHRFVSPCGQTFMTGREFSIPYVLGARLTPHEWWTLNWNKSRERRVKHAGGK